METGRTFFSYQDFERHLADYCCANNTYYVKRSSQPIKNPHLSHLKYQSVLFTCKQGGSRQSSTLTGERSIHKTVKLGCPVKFRLKVQQPKEGQPHLTITVSEMEHQGHEVKTEDLQSSETREGQTQHILIGCTGSVASIKIPPLVIALKQALPRSEILVVATDKAQHFFKLSDLAVPLYTDQHEWETWSTMKDPVLHIELRRWADVFLIAPLDANTMAKIATGMCDNLLTCVARAWDVKKPLLFAPAMNSFMWDHPVTGKNMEALRQSGYIEVPCIYKKLACGDTGFGAMAEVPTLVAAVKNALNVKIEPSSIPNNS